MKEFAGRRRSNLHIPFVSLSGRDNAGGNPFVFNQQPLTKWQTDRAAVKAGTGRARVVFAGDSSPASYGCDPIGSFQAVNAQDARLARLFTASGLASTYNSLFAGHGAVTLGSWDFRASQGAWTYENPASFGITVGGEFFQATTPGPAISTYTPADNNSTAVATDSCDLYYATDPSQGAISGQVNLLTVVPISQTAASLVHKTTLSGTLGNNVYKAIYVSGTANWIGFHCYNSAVKAVDFWNMGAIGSFATQWDSTAFSWNPASCWSQIVPSIVFFSAGANDVLGGATTAATLPHVVAAINFIKAVGADVVVMGYNPIDTASLSASGQQALRDMMYQAAVTTGCTFYDVLASMGGTNGYAANNAAGKMFNTLHRNFLGYTPAVNDIYGLLAA